MALALAPVLLSLLAAFQSRLLGQLYIGDGSDSTRRAARRRERASLFYIFHARLPQTRNFKGSASVSYTVA
jgi:hypothetical protein